MVDLVIVEDAEDIADVLQALLSARGYHVRMARNGIEGLKLLDQRLPQVVLTDVEMPELDGPSMIYRMFVEDLGRENIPVVLMSGVPQLARVAAAVGTRYFISKPFELARLLQLIERALHEALPPHPHQ